MFTARSMLTPLVPPLPRLVECLLLDSGAASDATMYPVRINYVMWASYLTSGVLITILLHCVVFPHIPLDSGHLRYELYDQSSGKGVLCWKNATREVRFVQPDAELAAEWGVPIKGDMPRAWYTDQIRKSTAEFTLLGMSATTASGERYFDSISRGGVVLSEAIGWPMRCAEWHECQPQFISDTRGVVALGARFRSVFGPGVGWVDLLSGIVFVPTNVSFVALFVNLLVCGGASTLAGVVIHKTMLAALSFTRKRSGRCPGCGYSRSGLAREMKCPECGRK
jgi:hypothetical protein